MKKLTIHLRGIHQYNLLLMYIRLTMIIVIGREHSNDVLTVACEVDLVNAIPTADITFVLSSSNYAEFLSPLSVQCSQTFAKSERSFICKLSQKCNHKTIIEFGFYMISFSTSSDNCFLFTPFCTKIGGYLLHYSPPK